MFDSIEVNPDLKALWKAQDDATEIVPCTNDPDLFFPERGMGGGMQVADIRAACANCPIVAQCAEYGIKHEPEYGFWGGLSVEQREQIRSLRRRGLKTPA